MNTQLLFLLNIILILSLIHTTSYARPEYMLETKFKCSACHTQPFGGGQRNETMGKSFGLRTWSPWVVPLLPVSADIRFLMNGKLNKEGMGGDPNLGLRQGILMSSILSGHHDFLKSSKNSLMLSSSYDLGVFIPGIRDLYLSYAPKDLDTNRPSFILGRFRLPFGLMTDEHRTMSRQLTKTTNRDFSTGVGINGTINSNYSYSVAFINSVPEHKASFDQKLKLGFVADIKWLDPSLPVLIGTSILNYSLQNQSFKNIQANSVYFGLNLRESTRGLIGGSLLLERFQTSGLNDSRINTFIERNYIPIGLTTELNNIQNSTSSGYMGQIKLAVHPKLNLVYKYDYAKISGTSPAYIRAGYGLDLAFFHTNIIIRLDKSISAGPKFSTNNNTVSTEDMFYIVFHLWI